MAVPKLTPPTLFVLACFVALAGFAGWQSFRARGQDPVGHVTARQATPSPGDDVVAMVNGETIPVTALRNRLLQQQVAAAQGVPTASPEEIVNALVEDMLLRQEARRRGLECTEGQLREFVSFHLANLTASDRKWLSETYGVPDQDLESSPTIMRLYSGACTEVQVRRAIAAERSDLPPEEAVDAFLAQLRSASRIQVRQDVLNATADQISSAR